MILMGTKHTDTHLSTMADGGTAGGGGGGVAGVGDAS
jgi:hypothetical protein